VARWEWKRSILPLPADAVYFLPSAPRHPLGCLFPPIYFPLRFLFVATSSQSRWGSGPGAGAQQLRRCANSGRGAAGAGRQQWRAEQLRRGATAAACNPVLTIEQASREGGGEGEQEEEGQRPAQERLWIVERKQWRWVQIVGARVDLKEYWFEYLILQLETVLEEHSQGIMVRTGLICRYGLAPILCCCWSSPDAGRRFLASRMGRDGSLTTRKRRHRWLG
jgi:hypothetical protein